DLYSLACVLYLLTTGESAFKAETAQAYFSQHLVRGPRPFAESDKSGRVPESLRQLILKTLAKDRTARVATADEMKDAFLVERRSLSPLIEMPDAKADTASVLRAVHQRVMARREAARASAALDMPTVHVDQEAARPAPSSRPPVEVRSAPPDLRAAPSAQ